ncbi:MAG: alpha/beta hydrolase [Myxococcales bacterium]|nr:MAG: alpha/beta hydrolase [Myxococcales bacterium]
MLRTLDALPRRWESRETFVSALIEAGQPPPIAQWLAMNLRRTNDGGRTFGPDLGVIRDLLEDYARADDWDVIEELPEGSTLDVVIGGRSEVFSSADRRRIEDLATRKSGVSVHVIERAGHWVHVDATDALVALLTSPRTPQR